MRGGLNGADRINGANAFGEGVRQRQRHLTYFVHFTHQAPSLPLPQPHFSLHNGGIEIFCLPLYYLKPNNHDKEAKERRHEEC